MFKKLKDNFWILIVLTGIFYIALSFFPPYSIASSFNFTAGILTIVYGLLLHYIVKLSYRKLPKINLITTSPRTKLKQTAATNTKKTISVSRSKLPAILTNSFFRAFTAWAAMILLHVSFIFVAYGYPLHCLFVLIFIPQAGVYFSRTGGFVDAKLNKKELYIKIVGAILGIIVSISAILLVLYFVRDRRLFLSLLFVPPAIGALVLVVNRILRARRRASKS